MGSRQPALILGQMYGERTRISRIQRNMGGSRFAVAGGVDFFAVIGGSLSTPCHETHRQLALDANVAPSIRALTRVLLQILVDASVELVPFLICGIARIRKRFQHTIYSAHFLDPEAILLRPIDVATPLLPVLGTGEVA